MMLMPSLLRSQPYRIALIAGAMLFGHDSVAATSAPPPALPDDVRALVASTDTLLAYKSADLYNDGMQSVVMVIRHPVTGKSDYDFDSNPCELVVLHRQNGKLAETDRSTKAVDCTYNDVARNAPALSLNDNLTLAPASIVYVNQKDKGDSTFYFAWSKEKNAWYLQRATASNPDGTHVSNVSASYPGKLPWATMSSLEPDAIAAVLAEQAKASR